MMNDIPGDEALRRFAARLAGELKEMEKEMAEEAKKPELSAWTKDKWEIYCAGYEEGLRRARKDALLLAARMTNPRAALSPMTLSQATELAASPPATPETATP